jgi:hypothetical protein
MLELIRWISGSARALRSAKTLDEGAVTQRSDHKKVVLPPALAFEHWAPRYITHGPMKAQSIRLSTVALHTLCGDFREADSRITTPMTASKKYLLRRGD